MLHGRSSRGQMSCAWCLQILRRWELQTSDAPRTPAQVIDVCRKANPRLVVKRARFSALVRAELVRSMAQLASPDENASRAVDARQEIDLRIGASFTRFQTLLLQVPRHPPALCSSGGGILASLRRLRCCQASQPWVSIIFGRQEDQTGVLASV